MICKFTTEKTSHRLLTNLQQKNKSTMTYKFTTENWTQRLTKIKKIQVIDYL